MKNQQNAIYREWINYLVEQNSDLIQAVADVEREACTKLDQLEGVVQRNGSLNEKNLASDVNNLVEYIRRAREDGKWDGSNLKFYCINKESLIGADNAIG